MFETLLIEWRLTPEYIIDHWTDEKLLVMVEAMSDRVDRMAAATRGDGGVVDATGPTAALLPGVEYANERRD